MNTEPYDFTTFAPEIEERVDDLLARMTLEEKVGQMNQISGGWQGDMEGGVRSGEIGSILNIWDVEQINHLQRIAVEESRLGIPLLVGTDVIHGYRTIFPIPLAQSCTWDPELIERAERVAADEAAATGTDWIFAPMVDIARDPRWGRIAEGAGEDPFLGRAMARARVRGFQAQGLAGGRKIVACPKHYVAYGAAEAGKDYNTVDISERVLRNVYLPPFKAAFDAGAGSVMSSFNEIAGVPASANAFILRTILRDEWDLPIVVLSDYDAIGELVQHGAAADLKEAAYRAIMAGEDMDMMSLAYPLHLAELVREGAVPEALVDEAVRRVLRLKFALGLFEHPYVDAALEEEILLRDEHLELALEVAQKSMVLLKNEDGLLPLPPDKKIALIGPLAANREELLGSWSCAGEAEDVETVLEGMQAVLAEAGGGSLEYVAGCAIAGGEGLDIAAAVTAAMAADVAVVVVGESAAMSGEAHSRAYLDLPGYQNALVEAVVKTGTPVVAVVMSGRPLALTWMDEHVPAVLMAWQGGVRTGRAVADILFGNVNPSAKLTASFPRTEGQVPVYYAHKSTGRPVRERGVIQFNRAHRTQFLDVSHLPLYGFGYGLSYTTFTYSDLEVMTPEVSLDGMVRVSATVTNSGERAGDEIVQLYVQDLVAQVTRPVRELKGFQRLSLEPGESHRVTFEVPVAELGFHGLPREGEPGLPYIVEPGQFKVWVAPHAYEGLEGEFEVIA